MAERISWQELARLFYREHRQGDHVAVVGPTDSGKSMLLVELAKIRASRTASDGNPSRVTYLAAKPRDKTVDELGWPIAKRWPPSYGQWHVIVWPPYGDPETAAGRQRRVFRPLLKAIFAEGGQTVVIDEIAYFTDPLPDGLGLKPVIHQYLTVARSSDLSLFGATQRPRNVPRAFWSEPKWLFLFRIDDTDDLRRVREIGGNREGLVETIEQLDDHEFVLVRRQGTRRHLYTSKVELP